MASLYNDASLVMIPSAYKDDKLYSIKPTNGDGDFTFSRDGAGASPATRVNASGYIEKGRTNELLQSNDFDTTWLNQLGGTITGGQADKDGGTDAWLIDKDTSTFRSVRQVVSFSGVTTLSVYAKSGSLSDAGLRMDTGGGALQVLYNLSTGVASYSGGTLIDYGMQDVGSGWYRLYITANVTSGTNVHIYADRDGTTAGNIVIMNAMLEQSMVPTDYIATTTAPVSAGLLGDMPRLDYSGGATCPSLLLEPSRTNLLAHSEYQSAANWTQTRCTIEDNTSDTLSPEGVYNAAKMTSTDVNESYNQIDATTTGTVLTHSFYAKAGDLDYCHGLVWDKSANGCRQWFNLSTGAVGSATTLGTGYSVVSGSASIEDMGNGWYRCSYSANVTAGTQGVRVNLSSADATLTSAVNTYGYFYGIQAEDASYPTSYIPTYSAAANRGADVCKVNTITSRIGQSSGSVFLDFDNNFMSSYSSEYLFQIDDNAANQLWLRKESGGNTFTARLIVGSLTTWTFSGISVVDGNNKMAIRYDSGNNALFLNGSQVGSTNTSTYSGLALNDLAFNRNDGSVPETNMKQFILFPTALTDAECIALTTI